MIDRRFCIAHLSDLHFALEGPLAPRAVLNKRLLGLLSWWIRRRHAHRPEILDALYADLRRVAPDHVAITGDLTVLGLPLEFEAAARQLRRLGPPEQVSVVPGNHDAYVPVPWASSWQFWADYMTTDTATPSSTRPVSGFDDFPWVRERGGVALIGLSSAVPTAPFVAQGRLGDAQLERLEAALAELARTGLCRVVLIHHSPVEGTVHRRKGLTDAAALRAILRRHGAELILHGHEHRARIASVPGPHGAVPVLGVPPVSELPRPNAPGRGAQYHLIGIGARPDAWEVVLTPRRYDRATGTFRKREARRFVIARPRAQAADDGMVSAAPRA